MHWAACAQHPAASTGKGGRAEGAGAAAFDLTPAAAALFDPPRRPPHLPALARPPFPGILPPTMPMSLPRSLTCSCLPPFAVSSPCSSPSPTPTPTPTPSPSPPLFPASPAAADLLPTAARKKRGGPTRGRVQSICLSGVGDGFGGHALRRNPKRTLKNFFAKRISTREDAVRELLGSVFAPAVLAKYTLTRCLGHGAFGTGWLGGCRVDIDFFLLLFVFLNRLVASLAVFLVKSKETGADCALKAIQKRKVTNTASLRNEIDALKRAKTGCGVTHLLDNFEDAHYV